MQRSIPMAVLGLLTIFCCSGAQCVGDLYGTNSSAKEFVAALTGDDEVPSVETEGTGSGTFTLNEDETELSFDITASGLSGPVTAAHFHNAFPNQSGPVVFDIGDTITETDGEVRATGVWPLGSGDLTELRAEYIYVNLHTDLHPTGEIRGQLRAAQGQ